MYPCRVTCLQVCGAAECVYVCAFEQKNVILNVSYMSPSQLLWHDISFSACTSCWHFDDTLLCKAWMWHIKCLSSIPSLSLGVLHLFIQLLCVPGICQRKRLWPIWSPETGWVSWPLGYRNHCEQAASWGVMFFFPIPVWISITEISHLKQMSSVFKLRHKHLYNMQFAGLDLSFIYFY